MCIDADTVGCFNLPNILTTLRLFANGKCISSAAGASEAFDWWQQPTVLLQKMKARESHASLLRIRQMPAPCVELNGDTGS